MFQGHRRQPREDGGGREKGLREALRTCKDLQGVNQPPAARIAGGRIAHRITQLLNGEDWE